ncbi:MAG: VWA domain-containing protein [Deltaproteobacteria bacterium]|nr:VWA domain-containing protein [Deltaproteobacteria bacterium]
MGYGAYSYEAHRALTLTRQAKPAQEVFQQRACHPLMDPQGITLRESRDSPEHPESLGIVFALDVTGSMGAIPQKLATRDLPGFLQRVIALGIDHPQVLFLGVGDATGDRAPLQIGQFESTAELMDQWLTSCWLESGGGRGDRESYELALFFAARHVAMDCHLKRGQRGYLFLTGDEKPYPRLARQIVLSVLGHEIDTDFPTAAVVEEVQHLFEPFFLIPDLARRSACEREWRDLLGDRVVCLEHPDDTCLAAASLIALDRGLRDLDQIAAGLAEDGEPRERVNRIARALMPFAASLGRDGCPSPSIDPGVPVPGVAMGASPYRLPDD